jgi:hypothetical protein
MTPHRAINALLVLCIISLYALVAHLDGPSDHQAQADNLANLQAISKAEAAQQRLAIAAQSMCGENAGWQLVSDSTVQCTTKRGFKTRKAAL